MAHVFQLAARRRGSGDGLPNAFAAVPAPQNDGLEGVGSLYYPSIWRLVSRAPCLPLPLNQRGGFTGMLELPGIRLSASDKWIFYPFENLILAKRDNGCGTLQLSTAFRHDVSPDAGHEAVRPLALEFAGIDVGSGAVEIVTSAKEGKKIGTFSAHSESEFKKYWYVLGAQGLVLAIYQAGLPCQNQTALEVEVLESQDLVESLEFTEP